jgi:GntR family transcriptional regulator of vanillate catabolism
VGNRFSPFKGAEKMAESTGRSQTIRAQAVLRQRILSGELKGGQRLMAVPLAEELNISRTPVREAMSRLAEEGLLERSKTTGFVVRTFELEDIYHAMDLRGVLEGMAVRYAAERGAEPALLKEMAFVVRKLDESVSGDEIDFDAYSSLNSEFHSILSRMSGSRLLEKELNRVSRLPFAAPFPFSPAQYREKGQLELIRIGQFQHREILSAIENREGARAEVLAREHARLARSDLGLILAQRADMADRDADMSLITA